jgi:L-lactate dehydrogenase complex protein LldF
MGMNHAELANKFVADEVRARRHDTTLWMVRAKRDEVAAQLPEWEQLRSAAADIKAYTISHLADLLEQFENRAIEHGAHVHWACDARELNEIVFRILSKSGSQHVVKSKSMLTEECHLNSYLIGRGIEVIDTDLGERIVQLRNEPPSHIVMPAVHLSRNEIGELFHQHFGIESGASDPKYLTDVARGQLRACFMQADAGITGVNFAVAQTGGVVICTNEGNADLTTSLPNLHIACMGIEKVIPRTDDLAVMLRLLARSATGQPITTYTSHFHGPRPGSDMHIVILDNGRTQILEQPDHRRSLSCIRCGACMNTCPVYRRSGGHAYETTVPGPIGSILAPAKNLRQYRSLPFACTMCGSCTDVCPVKINLHQQLLHLRQEIGRAKLFENSKSISNRVVRKVMEYPRLYEWTGWILRFLMRALPRFVLYGRWNKWGIHRELPEAPTKSFRSLFAKRRETERKSSMSSER